MGSTTAAIRITHIPVSGQRRSCANLGEVKRLKRLRAREGERSEPEHLRELCFTALDIDDGEHKASRPLTRMGANVSKETYNG